MDIVGQCHLNPVHLTQSIQLIFSSNPPCTAQLVFKTHISSYQTFNNLNHSAVPWELRPNFHNDTTEFISENLTGRPATRYADEFWNLVQRKGWKEKIWYTYKILHAKIWNKIWDSQFTNQLWNQIHEGILNRRQKPRPAILPVSMKNFTECHTEN